MTKPSRKQYAVLKDSPAFRGIPQEDVEGLLADLGAFERSYGKDFIIFHVGDTLDYFPVLLSGQVKAELVQGDRKQLVSVFNEGESFAEAVPVSLGACPVEVTALTKVLVLCIPADDLQENLDVNARRLHANLMTEMSKKIASLSAKLSLLGEPKLSDRILKYLRALPEEADGSVRVPMKYTELAGYLGVNKASLSRCLRSMEDDGQIVMNKHNITILQSASDVAANVPGVLNVPNVPTHPLSKEQ